MERLSKELTDIINEQDFCFTPGEMKTVEKALGRLKSYEDTGLEPEEIERLQEYMKPFTIQDMDRFREIMDAEKAGRLVVLPCKVGDKVWVIMENREIYSFIVRGISMSDTCTDTILRFGVSFQWGSNIGKKWFLSRKEAEEALREEADNG